MDIGNTNIVCGVYDSKKLITYWRLASDREKSADEFGIMIVNVLTYNKIPKEKIKAILISSVVPNMMYQIEHMCRRYFELNPMIVGPGMKTGMNIRYENPKEVGADRIVNAIAAYESYGGPLIVVDFGTATTFCAISQNGDYLGGCIAPGIKISAEALYQKAAKLPRVELVKPASVICRNTVSSMQAGILFGYTGQVDYIVQRMKKELQADKVTVVATGGLARLIAEESQTIQHVEPLLTIEGLRILYERNC